MYLYISSLCVHVCKCMCVEVSDQPWVSFFRWRPPLLRECLSWRSSLDWPGQQARGIPTLPLQCWLPSMSHHAQLFPRLLRSGLRQSCLCGKHFLVVPSPLPAFHNFLLRNFLRAVKEILACDTMVSMCPLPHF